MEPKISYLELLKPFHIKPREEIYYIEALTHSSYAHEHHESNLKHYEKLEFMGDAVFQLVSAELIYNSFPDKSEGELTKLRSKLVRTESFAKLGRELQIHEMMYLGHGEEKDRGKKDKIIEDVVEAFIGALFIDRGYKIARIVARRWLLKILSELKEDEVEAVSQKIADSCTYRITTLENGVKTVYVAVDLRTCKEIFDARVFLNATKKLLAKCEELAIADGMNSNPEAYNLMSYNHLAGELALHMIMTDFTNDFGANDGNILLEKWFKMSVVADLNVDESRISPALIAFFGKTIVAIFGLFLR